MKTQIRIVGATLLIIFGFRFGNAQVSNSPQAATAAVLEIGPDRIWCAGMNTYLNAGPNYVSYLWSTGETTQFIQVTAVGTYWARVLDATGNYQTDTVQISPAPAPTADFIFLGTAPGPNFTNLSTNASVYFWDFGDGSNSFDANPIHTFPSNGNYTICLQAHSDCATDIFCQTINVTYKAKMSQAEIAEQELKVFPSPSAGPVSIDLGSLASETESIKVMNAAGVEVMSLTGISSQTLSLDLSEQAAGLYFVQVQTHENKYSKRVIKN